MADVNPWVSRVSPTNEDHQAPSTVAPANEIVRVRPQPAGVPRPAGGLPVASRPAAHLGGWWWLGCHGGAGVTSLAHAAPGGQDAGRLWPAAPPGWTLPVVLVARGDFVGLTAAQEAAAQWASGAVPGVDLLGLVLTPYSPERRLARPLRDLRRLVSGGVPRTWALPWVEGWRLGEPPASRPPRELAALGAELTRLTISPGSPHRV